MKFYTIQLEWPFENETVGLYIGVHIFTKYISWTYLPPTPRIHDRIGIRKITCILPFLFHMISST